MHGAGKVMRNSLVKIIILAATKSKHFGNFDK